MLWQVHALKRSSPLKCRWCAIMQYKQTKPEPRVLWQVHALIRSSPLKFWCAITQYKRTKPEPRMCPVCRENVGISWQSLAVHVRTKHGPAHEHLLAMGDSPKAG